MRAFAHEASGRASEKAVFICHHHTDCTKHQRGLKEIGAERRPLETDKARGRGREGERFIKTLIISSADALIE